jgi:hypothetical protein
MENHAFLQGLEDIYSAHGKAFPSPKICAAIFDRVRELPDKFMAFAVGELRDYPTLPSNLGRELRRVLWPQFAEKHPGLLAAARDDGCDWCRDGRTSPGWLWAHKSATGHVVLRRCQCSGGDMPQSAWDAGYEIGLPATMPPVQERVRQAAGDMLSIDNATDGLVFF